MSGFSNPTLATSFEDVRLLAADNITDLDVAPVGMRIVNMTAVWATVTFIPLGGSGPVQLDIPPSCVLSEPVRVKRIMVTGTTATLTIHGYFHN